MKNLIFHLSTKLKNHLSSGNGPAMDRKRTGVGLADVCRFTAVLVMLFSFNIGNVWGASATWELVETEPADWSGEYLIVYNGYCFDGSLDGGFDQHTPVSVTVNNKKITLDDSYSLTVAVSGTKYSLKSKSGYYIGRNTNSNGVDASKTWSTNYTVVFNTWNNTNKTVRIVGNGGRAVGRNGSSWGFYSTANAYVNIQLYKKASSCTGLTMSTVTAVPGNGS